MRAQHSELLIKREDDPLRHQRCTTDGRSATSLAKWGCRHNVIRTWWLPTLSVDNKHTCEKESGKTRRNQHCLASATVGRRSEQLLILQRTYRVGGNDYYTSKKKHWTPWRDLMQPSNIPIWVSACFQHCTFPVSSKKRVVPAEETIKGF